MLCMKFIILRKVKGIFYYGNNAIKIQSGSHFLLQPNLKHKLHNTENSELEHLVLAVPPFIPSDVYLVEDETKKSYIEPFSHNLNPIIAQDGAKIYEFFIEEREKLNFALAAGTLPIGRKASIHYHKESLEIYYIIQGKGTIHLEEGRYNVKRGDFVTVPVLTSHGLENTSDTDLEIICLSSPAYQDNDFFKIDKGI